MHCAHDERLPPHLKRCPTRTTAIAMQFKRLSALLRSSEDRLTHLDKRHSFAGQQALRLHAQLWGPPAGAGCAQGAGGPTSIPQQGGVRVGVVQALHAVKQHQGLPATEQQQALEYFRLCTQRSSIRLVARIRLHRQRSSIRLWAHMAHCMSICRALAPLHMPSYMLHLATLNVTKARCAMVPHLAGE